MDMSAINPYLTQVPVAFSSNVSASIWAYYDTAATAVLPNGFNRTLFSPPWQASVTDTDLYNANAYFNNTDFVAFAPTFLDLIGPNAKIDHIWDASSNTSHEASCFVPELNSLFFASWGFNHDFQYLLHAETGELRNITTSPPITNAHGCVYYNGHLYVATDGGAGTYASVYKVDPMTLNATAILNNFYQQPFLGFNDLDIDPNGNIWLTDSISAWVNYMTTFAPQTTTAVYFLNTTTLTPKWVFEAPGGWNSNVNGIAFAGDGTLYVDTTAISSSRPKGKYPLRTRALWAFDTRGGKPQLRDRRLFHNSISYYCDGVRVSKHGYVFCATGDGVDVIEPENGYTLGRIRVGRSGGLAVNVAFEDHVLWIVGRGGVWKVSGMKEQLKRDW
ncbi:hypothetical protein HII31_12907 [Pseudocercospora fuligena]|uniref:SMP-30/Gluconolactonase/LRE-like region domain-containing protein n=1 Tax=Pseudocercospora fuligena TaxID=685502 RepID=A0A8H6R5V0_9PEZI|nr:hypothetical protein HII31_12907 [Pseudocercospora fuligena]